MVNQQGSVSDAEAKLEAISDPKPQPPFIRAIETEANLEQQDISNKKGMEDSDIMATTQEHPIMTLRFITRARRNQEEAEKGHPFRITTNEMMGTTGATRANTGGPQIFARVNGTVEAGVMGTIEGGVIGVTEGAWEAIGVAAFEGAAELDVTAATVLLVNGNAKLDPSGIIEGGIATMSSIQFQVPERHVDIKWRIQPRYTQDQGTESTNKGNLIWNRPTESGIEARDRKEASRQLG
jgi:hypothetical protein